MTVLASAARSSAIAASKAAARSATGQPGPSIARAAIEAPVRDARKWVRLLIAMVTIAVMLSAAAVAGGGSANPTCGANGAVVFDADLDQILATIRTLESGHDYTAINNGNGYNRASGAYQFLRRTWDNYGGYPEAWQAPPETQDAKAAAWVNAILVDNNGDVGAVPVSWYIGEGGYARLRDNPAAPGWDTVPSPEAGNRLTPREYQTEWMALYADPIATQPGAPGVETPTFDTGPRCVGVVGEGDYRIPDGVNRLVGSSISWGGYENGLIPLEAMRYSANSNYLHPSASASWDQLHAAALEAGFDLSGNGYRPRAAGGQTAGTSNHGWGLAIDVNVLVVGQRFATREAAFASPEYEWLAANAPLYGWLNPDWARPVSLGGTGEGGWVGDQCCFLEPWHWEWGAFMNQYIAEAP